ncbi:unnamed protein product [Cyprideis torosa]|uniref:Uncharacterized protein n=1 Tax=Cyprideis torosa TaxID=163714 RepID=A0A7R8WMH3_9CRUS|nr:unnamed protein product [Cyprideis torosa]CAG0899339.1 unnamed protein product [Cyprideis torosa]
MVRTVEKWFLTGTKLAPYFRPRSALPAEIFPTRRWWGEVKRSEEVCLVTGVLVTLLLSHTHDDWDGMGAWGGLDQPQQQHKSIRRRVECATASQRRWDDVGHRGDSLSPLLFVISPKNFGIVRSSGAALNPNLSQFITLVLTIPKSIPTTTILRIRLRTPLNGAVTTLGLGHARWKMGGNMSGPGYKILGYPISIDHSRYARNALLFNLCFVFDAGSRTVQYEPVVKKLSEYLVTVEEEHGFLSKQEREQDLVDLMNQVFNDLRDRGASTVRINDANTVHLAVHQIRVDPDPVREYDVPVFVGGKEALVTDKWDLNAQQILPFIDGFNHIAKIAAESDVEEKLVKKCVQNLVFEGIVKICPMFLYTSTYTPTPAINKLYIDRDLQERCIRYVSKGTDRSLPSCRDVLGMYCAFGPGITVRDICLRHNPHALSIDERKLIQFGLLEGLIRRVNIFPICTDHSKQHRLVYHSSKPELQPLASSRDTKRQLHMMSNGTQSLDEICCQMKESVVEILKKIETDASLNVIYK